jgi:putative ABC transport system permease protein
MAFRAELRRRWRSWLAIALLISVVGGLVLAATAAGRRTESAFPTFVAAHGFDADVYTTQPVPKIAKIPGVSSATEVIGEDNGQPTCDCTHPINPADLGVIVVPRTDGRSFFKLVSGHLPDPSAPNQVLATFTLQQDGVHLGTVIHVPLYAASQVSAYNNAVGAPPKPRGPTVALRVVGFEAAEFEFPAGATPSYDLYATPAFARTVLPRTAVGYVYFVRLRHGAAGLARFEVEARPLSGVEGYGSQSEQAASVETSIHPQAIGWWILAALAGLVGVAVVGQGLARQSIVESEDYPTMAAMGVDRRQLVTLGVLRNLVVGLAGAVGAVALAIVLSPIAPLGEARVAESSTGISFDALVLPLGALATVAIVLALGVWPAARAARALRSDDRAVTSRPSVLAGHLVAVGARPSAVIGVRNALERRSGGATVPVGSALLGTVLAVIALCGTAVFGASLSHLTATPRLYGDPFQINFTDPEGGPPSPALLRSLERDGAVTAITHGIAIEASVNKLPVGGIAVTAIRGRPLLSSVNGHLPSGDGQIGLGATTMHQVGAHLGSVVHVTVSLPSGKERTVPFRVVSQVSFPVLGGVLSLGTGVVFTIAGYEAAVCPPGPKQAVCQQEVEATAAGSGLLISVVTGPKGQAAVDHYLDTYQSAAALPVTPTSLINFGEAVNFPLLFGAMLAVFGAATLAHLLVVSVSRRRREVGLLKVVGFVNGQVASTVAWQATTLAIVGIVIGVPLGVIAGQAVWRAFANNLGAVPVSVVPIWLIGVVVAGVLVVANLIAVAPALVATRSKPGELLRTS